MFQADEPKVTLCVIKATVILYTNTHVGMHIVYVLWDQVYNIRKTCISIISEFETVIATQSDHFCPQPIGWAKIQRRFIDVPLSQPYMQPMLR